MKKTVLTMSVVLLTLGLATGCATTGLDEVKATADRAAADAAAAASAAEAARASADRAAQAAASAQSTADQALAAAGFDVEKTEKYDEYLESRPDALIIGRERIAAGRESDATRNLAARVKQTMDGMKMLRDQFVKEVTARKGIGVQKTTDAAAQTLWDDKYAADDLELRDLLTDLLNQQGGDSGEAARRRRFESQ